MPVHNTHPNSGLHFEKKKKRKKEAENRESGYGKIALKHHDLETLKKTMS